MIGRIKLQEEAISLLTEEVVSVFPILTNISNTLVSKLTSKSLHFLLFFSFFSNTFSFRENMYRILWEARKIRDDRLPKSEMGS